MLMTNTRLRGNKARIQNAWPLGSFPKDVIVGIGKRLVHRMVVGHSDITGDDFGNIFADAIEGKHLLKPLGIADVLLNGNAWSVKTVKAVKPFDQKIVRLISGRNSPDYSLGIENPHTDIQATGKAILMVWNARIDESLHEHNTLRIAVLARNFETKEFVLFEEDAARFSTDDFFWIKNKQGNFEGHNKNTQEHCFTWQPHGAQFTIKRHVPGSAVKFIINQNPPLVEVEHVLRLAEYNDDWIEIVDTPS